MRRTYRGVVKERTVVLVDGDDLPDGTAVEVTVLAGPEDAPPRARVPDAVKAEMLARGLVLEFKEPLIEASLNDYEPIEVAGTPLSELIIEERR